MPALSRLPHLLRFRPNGCDLLATTALTLGLGCLCAGPAWAQTASGTNATAVGPNATASGDESFAGGYNATASGRRSVAIGSGAKAQSATTNQGIINYRDASGVGITSAGTDGNIATGSNGSSTPPNEPAGSAGAMPSGTAIGENSVVGSGGGVAIGTNNTAGTGTFNSTAIGVDNNSAGRFSTAIGYGNTATGRSAVSFGTNNQALGDSSIAMGRQSYAIGDFSFAQGFVASAYGTDAIALGSLAVAGESSGTPTKSNIAIGDRSSALGGSAVALGSGASAGNARSVAIGAGSTASRAAGSRNELFSGTALSGSNTEFSVGSAGNERQITNVAGGTADTDAVNVRQLRSVGGSLATTIGSSFDPSTGTYAAPTYRYGGTDFSTVPSVIQAIDDFGLRYDRDGSGNPANSIDLTRGGTIGSGGTVAIRGLGAGTVSASSTDAINGGQLYGTAASTASALGGGATVAADGTLRAPSYTVQGTNYGNVGAALAGADRAISTNAANIATNTTNIATTTTDLSDLRRTIGNGTIGLVQQDPTSRAVTVASATDGNQVDFAGTAGNRRLSGLANGVVDSDAATLGQLRLSGGALAQGLGGGAAYDPATGVLTAPSYSVGGKSYGDVGSALAATNSLSVQYVPDANGAATGRIDLTRGGPGGAVALQGVANGRIAAGSTDAINGGQLYGTAASTASALGGGATVAADGTLRAPSYTVQGTSYGDVGNALAATDRAVTTNATGIASGATRIAGIETGLDAGTVGLLRRDPSNGALTIGAQTDGTTLGVANNRGQSRTITGVAAGGLSASSTDAVNGGQLFATNQTVATNTTNIATTTTDLSDLRRTIGNGTIGLVQQDPTSRAVTVASATDGNQVNFAGTAGNRRLSGLANGVVDSDAATLGQLRLSGGALAQGLGGGAVYDPATGVLTAPSYSVGGKSYGDVGAALAATNSLSVQYVPDANGAATGRIDLTRGGPGGAVALQGVENGRIAAGSTDAVNGGQLNDTNTAVAQLSNAVGSGNVGLVRQDPTSRRLTVGGSTDGTSVSFANGTGQARTLGGVAAGSVAAGSLEAVNGGQLRGTAGSVAAALGGGATVAADGTVSAPAYLVQGRSYGSVGTALTAADRAVTANTTAIAGNTAAIAGNTTAIAGNTADIAKGATRLAALETGVAAGTVGLLRRDPADGTLTIGAQSDGTSLKLANKNGRSRTVSGVAAGRLAAASTEAVNGGQLYETNDAVARLTSEVGSGTIGLVRQDPTSRVITIGGATDGTAVSLANAAGGARQLTGVADGRVASGSRDAVNGGQLAASAASTAAALGGGTRVAADGTLSAPAYAVQGKTYNSVGTALAATDRAVSTNAAGLAATGTQLAALTAGVDKGTVGLVRQDQTGRGLTIGAETDGTTLSLSNKNGQGRVVSGVAAGSLKTTSTEAVNGAQLNATNQTINNLSKAVTEGTVGLVRQDAASRGLTVGANTDGTTVGFANGSGQARTLTGVADGRIAAGSREAVNGGQLRAATAATAAALGGGAKVGADGKLVGPQYTVQGKTYGDVGSALGNLDVAVTNLTHSGSRYVSVKSTGKAAQATGGDSVAIGAGTTASADGGVALGSGAVADRAGLRGGKEAFSGTSVASTAGAVSVGKAGAERQITHVAGGTADTDAVNVRQLKSAGNQLAAALGGGASFGADGRLTKPSYAVNGKTYDNAGAALGALDTYSVKYDVDPASGGRGQSLTLSGGDPNKPVLIRNVADGIAATDAATFGQVTRVKAESVAYTDAKALETLTASTSYTDKRVAPLESQMASFGTQLADLNRQVGDVRTEARRGAAIGLAAAALRFDDRPGKLSVAAGGGVWRGESAASFGLGYTLPDGSARVNATGVTAGRDFGIGAGASFTLN